MADNWGYKIKELRKAKGWTQTELASKTGLGRGHIARIEMGAYKNPSQRTFERLASAFGFTTTELTRVTSGREPAIHLETPEDILERLRVSISSTVPIYEDFPFHAGGPVEPVGYAPVVKDRARGRHLEGYIAHGNCLEPDIKDGYIIIVDRDGQIDNGDIVACLVNGELYLARLRKIADDLYLENNNGRIKLEEAQVSAPVIEVRRRLK